MIELLQAISWPSAMAIAGVFAMLSVLFLDGSNDEPCCNL